MMTPAAAPTLPNSHLSESPILGDYDAFGCRRQCEDALVAIALADDLGIDDVEAALNQPLHDCPGDTFIREESQHALLTQL